MSTETNVLLSNLRCYLSPALPANSTDLRLKSNMNRGSANQRISVSTDPHRGAMRVISGRNKRPRSYAKSTTYAFCFLEELWIIR